ncbi:MAG TPA: LamG domain-containing protein [Kiritimatiellia bacterium]|jgi:hypothetical protein
MSLRACSCLVLLACCAAADGPPVLHLPFEGSLAGGGREDFSAKPFGDGVSYDGGVAGQCLFVDGSGDWIDVELEDRVRLQGGGTLALWFKRDDWENPYKGGSGWQTIAHLDGMGVNLTAPGCPLHEPWAIEGSVERWSTNGGTSVTARTAGGFVRPDAWHHVAVTFDAASARAPHGGGRARLYVDGKLQETQDNAPVPTEKMVNPLRIGTWFKSNQAFRGWIDEVKVYDYPLTPAQVADDAGNPTSP